MHSNELQEYKGFTVKEINGLKNTVSFTNGIVIHVGQTIGDVDEEHVRRIQIRETIKSHIEKERIMFPKGIKVLSLFFIDEVAKYRVYDKTITSSKVYTLKYLNRNTIMQLRSRIFSKKSIINTYPNIPQTKCIRVISLLIKRGNCRFQRKKGEGGSDDESAYDLI